MWRSVVLSSALVLLASPAGVQANDLVGAASGFVFGQSLKLKDTMNFEDCSKQKVSGFCSGLTYCGKGDWTLSLALDYREPTVLVEVSCRPGESMLMDSSPAARVVGKAFSAANKTLTALTGGGRCLEVASAGSGGTKDKSENTVWQFEARAFAITPLDRYIAATANGKKLGKAAYNLTCDAFMYFGGGSLSEMMAGGGIFPQMGALSGPIPGFPVGTENLLGQLSNLSGGASGMTSVVTDAVGGSLGEFDAGGIGGDALNTATDAKETVELATCSPRTLALAKASASWKYGLLPLFMSDMLTTPRTCWATGNMVDNLTGNAAAMAQISTGGLTEMACAGSTLTDLTGGAMETLNKATMGLAGNCVGGWGPKKPAVGYAPNAIRPLSAALVGWRAYDYAVKGASTSKRGGGRNLRNTKGQPMFNLDYPFINNSGPLSDVVKPFTSGRRHSHKGSGCYSPGTMNPSWYTQGETYIADPLKFFESLTEDTFKQVTKQGLPTNNGDYVFTYWKNTRCCIPLGCPRKTYRDY